MVPRKEVASLEDLCLMVVHSLIENIIQNHEKNDSVNEAQLVEDLKKVVCRVPPALHDKVADLHLRRIKQIFGDPSSNENEYRDESSDKYEPPKKCSRVNENEARLDLSLKVMCLLKIKKVKLSEKTTPTYLENKLIGLLDKMPCIESFSFEFTGDTVVDGRLLTDKLLKTAGMWSNLTTFICEKYCTDELLALVCKNCKLLQEVGLNCKELQDPITPLLACENLVRVHLGILEPKDSLKLLLESNSKNLTEIDSFVFDTIIDELELKECSRSFQLQSLTVSGEKLNEKYLNLLVKYFPSVTNIVLDGLNDEDPQIASKLYILSTLKHLREVTIVNLRCKLPTVISESLSTCPHLTTVIYSSYSHSDLSFFLKKLSRSCPAIKKLIINSCSSYAEDFSDPYTFKERPTAEPFQNLTHLIWWDAPLTYFIYILRYATNIKIVELYRCGFCSSRISFNNEQLKSILKYNSLNQLEKLYVSSWNNLSVEMMKKIIINCEKLTAFSVYKRNTVWDNWDKYTPLYIFIAQNNYGVDFEILADESTCTENSAWRDMVNLVRWQRSMMARLESQSRV